MMKRDLTVIASICVFYSLIGFCAPNPASMDWVKSYIASIPAIGQSALGGVIYYVYTDSAGVRHGLVAATADEPGAGSSGKYTWDASGVDPNSAQYACAHKRVTVGGVTYSGWIVPNLAQMTALFDNRYAIAPNDPNGGFIASESLFTNNYWTSIEADNGNPWCMSFGNAFMVDSSDASRQQSVRCIRTF